MSGRSLWIRILCRMNGKKEQSDSHQGQMNDDLSPQPRCLLEDVSVQIPAEEHRLKEQNACRPHGRRAAEEGQKHLADHRFEIENEEGAEEKCKAEKNAHFAGKFGVRPKN